MRPLLVFFFATCISTPAFADWFLDESGGVVGGESCPGAVESSQCRRVAMPCVGTSLAATPDRLYVTCDSGGVLVIDPSTSQPLEIRRMLEAVPAKKVKLVDGKVWVETPVGSRPLESFDRSAPPVVSPPPVVDLPTPPIEKRVEEPPPAAKKSLPAPPLGTVVDLGKGWVIIDIGSRSGVVEGGMIEFLRVEEVDLGAGQIVKRERRIGVGQVDTLNEGRSKVELGLNERVPMGAIARPNPDGVTATGVLMTPRRPRSVWEIEVNTRPFLALGTLGGGAILDGRVAYRFAAPLALDAVFSPFAFGVARDGNVLTFAGNLLLSYDTTVFQIGLGAGATRINTLSTRNNDFIAGANAEKPGFRAGFSAAQYLRLGSVDGINIAVLNNFALFEEEFVFGGITVSGQLPLILFRQVAWIVAQGGGGVPGHIVGEIGLRVLARGNGGPGSVFFTPTVGGGLLTGEHWVDCEGFDFDGREPTPGICRQTYDYGGPLVGFGVEWRL